ncbi:alpha/beta hydrolase [Paenibacillus pectinilyticus]|uniref:Alpha/beta hydrolase n=1 Tax=Paenibacillus pectinilyticus TaxID=512399 RepID=A0A1C1A5A2_9BACL|nr:alpha/beta hydrolase [Paenibacillus pectinilyticus]OCT15734.1 alpha/beta hydrolase [Paenibacillus pectinilyticus]
MSTSEVYKKLVSLTEERAVVEHHEGLDIVIKRVPDSDVEGDLDPRVLTVALEMAERMASGPKMDFSLEGPENLARLRAMMGWPNVDVTVTAIETTHITIAGTNGEIPLRIYSPHTSGPLPAIVFFHGGGFIGGSVDCVENPCKSLAEKAGAVVINVDYRLAPENPFPAGLIDCFDAVKWVYDNAAEIQVNPQQMGVAGDSAGGNLAAVCSIMDRDQGTGMIKYQALLYPTVNMDAIPTEDFKWELEAYNVKHHHELIHGMIHALGASSGGLEQIYLQGKTAVTEPYVSPLLAEDVSGLPATLVIEAEYDYLRLEGEAYARRLIRAGVPTKMIRYNGVDHAFMDKIGLYPQAEDCMNEIAKGLKALFAE